MHGIDFWSDASLVLDLHVGDSFHVSTAGRLPTPRPVRYRPTGEDPQLPTPHAACLPFPTPKFPRALYAHIEVYEQPLVDPQSKHL